MKWSILGGRGWWRGAGPAVAEKARRSRGASPDCGRLCSSASAAAAGTAGGSAAARCHGELQACSKAVYTDSHYLTYAQYLPITNIKLI